MADKSVHKPEEESEESHPSFMGIDFGAIFGRVFSDNPFAGFAEIFKDVAPGTEMNVDEVKNTFDLDWDDVIKAAAHGAMSRIAILVQTKGKASGKSWFKGNFKRLFEPKKEEKEE